MNEPQNTPPTDSGPQPDFPAAEGPVRKPVSSRPASRLLSKAQLPLAILIAGGVLAYLLWPAGQAEESASIPPEVEIVKLVGQHRLAIERGTPLEKKLEVAPVVQQETRAAKLIVTGAVVARVPPSSEKSPAMSGLPAMPERLPAAGSPAEGRPLWSTARCCLSPAQ